ncbi:hypothetical protein ACFP2T_26275 [Plantactinospora solaniradicis]|uniref:Uncharacterized protein n=1 Tax=Plantactinospora solaniradicis TaxID=1723736 RepID=A0ABW1KD35_9ACTN
MAELWRQLINLFAWPAWLLVLIPAPLALIPAISAGFSCYTQAGRWKMPAALLRGGMAGLIVALPLTVLGGLFVDAVGLGRSAVVGAVGGMAIGVAGGFVAAIAWHLGSKDDSWRHYHSGSLLGDMGWDTLVYRLKYVDPSTGRWRWRRWPSRR